MALGIDKDPTKSTRTPTTVGVFRTPQKLDMDTPLEYHQAMNDEIKTRAVRRLKIIEGQVRGLQKMVEGDTYCIDIIAQASAVKEALSSVEDVLLENHLSTHVAEQMKSGKDAQAVEEILRVYKLKRKK